MKLAKLIILTLSFTITVAIPVQARPVSRHYGDSQHARAHIDNQLERRIDQIQLRINYSHANKSLNDQEYNRVQFGLNSIKLDMRSMKHRNSGRLTNDQRRMLETRLDRLNRQIHWLRRSDKRRPF